jgi:hypothetical protein
MACLRPPWHSMAYYADTKNLGWLTFYSVGFPFFNHIRFGGTCCSCCEFRQYIKSHAMAVCVYDNKGNEKKCNYSVTVNPGEDTSGDIAYGYRDGSRRNGPFPPEAYCGCEYKAFDMPGIFVEGNSLWSAVKAVLENDLSVTINPTDYITVLVQAEFEMKIYDTCAQTPLELEKKIHKIDELTKLKASDSVGHIAHWPPGVVNCRQPFEPPRQLPGQSIPIPG